MSLSMARYSEPFEGDDGKWFFHLQGRNGEIVMVSEGYDSKGNAERGIDDAKHAAREADRPCKLIVKYGDGDGESFMFMPWGTAGVEPSPGG